MPLALLKDLGIQSNNTKTVAGCLLFHDNPQDIPELSHAYIKAARFKETRKGFFLDQTEMEGCLPDQIDDAVKFVLKNIRLSGTIEGSKRIERYEYPPDIIREAIVNAVIHRDYSISGACILLAVYDDRLEVTSPGGLAGQVTVENIQDRQYNRNPIIAKRMFEMAPSILGDKVLIAYWFGRKSAEQNPRRSTMTTISLHRHSFQKAAYPPSQRILSLHFPG